MKNKSLALWKKANLVIPTGNSFLSKNKSESIEIMAYLF